MKNASRMARYMMMRTGREGGGYESNRYPSGPEIRNGYGGRGNEGGNYARDDYGVDNRFRDRRGREHYDNGRFAPRNGMDERMGGDDGGSDYRGGGDYRRESRPEKRTGEPAMNIIGFDRRPEIPMNYEARVDYKSESDMDHKGGGMMRGGAVGTMFDEETAHEWTRKMHNEDGTKGEHWNMDQVKKLMVQRGVQYNLPEVYAIINSLYSDYCKVFKKYGFNSPEAYLDLAIAWLNDSDAVEDKAMAYYECIVK